MSGCWYRWRRDHSPGKLHTRPSKKTLCKRLSARRMLQGLRQQQCCPKSVQVPGLVQKAWNGNAQFNSGRWPIFEIFRGHPVWIRYEHIRTAQLVYNIKKCLFSKVSPWRCTVQHQSASQRLVYGHLNQLNLAEWLENALYVGCLLPIRFVDPTSTKWVSKTLLGLLWVGK